MTENNEDEDEEEERNDAARKLIIDDIKVGKGCKSSENNIGLILQRFTSENVN